MQKPHPFCLQKQTMTGRILYLFFPLSQVLSSKDYAWRLAYMTAKKIVDKLEEKTMKKPHSANHIVEVSLLIAWLELFV